MAAPEKRLKDEFEYLIIREREKIIKDLKHNLVPLSNLSYLKTYKNRLLAKDTLAALEILGTLEEFVEEAIIEVRHCIRNLRSDDFSPPPELAHPLDMGAVKFFWQKEIARDLHDIILQNLTALFVELQFCQKLLELSFAKARKEYPSLKNLLLDYKQDLDQFPFRHNHLKKDDRLLPTLSRYIKNFSALSAIKIQLKVRGKEKKLSPKIHDNLFQICREAITNVIRHAEANKVEINLVFGRDRLRATITDDGKGFVLDKSEGDYFGIRGMRERTQILGGELVIHTAPGIGTKIGMSIPVDKRGF